MSGWPELDRFLQTDPARDPADWCAAGGQFSPAAAFSQPLLRLLHRDAIASHAY
jgi:hypothetical protein